MSHFTVLVIGDDVDAQLAPYQENNMGDCPLEYMEFVDEEDEFLKEYENGSENMVNVNGKYLYPQDKKFTKKVKGELGVSVQEIPAKYKQEVIPFKQLYKTFEEFCAKHHYKEERDEQENRYGFWTNPNSKWDWYAIGGRWKGMLRLKTGGDVDQACKHGIDFAGMRDDAGNKAGKRYDEARKLMGDSIASYVSWDEVRDVKCKGDIETARKVYNEQEAVQRLMADSNFMWGFSPSDFLVLREDYIQAARDGAIATFAVLKDGHWYEKGQMGWFGQASDEKEEEQWNKEFSILVDGLPDDILLTVVDCHI